MITTNAGRTALKTQKVMKTLDRFQFKANETGKNMRITLERYAEIMTAFPFEVSPKVNTLWIPFYSGNRTAVLNLNHEIEGFDEETGFLTGLNGNCETPYYVIIVSPTWTKETVDLLAKNLLEKLNLEQHKNSPLRALKASRIEEIVEVISETKALYA